METDEASRNIPIFLRKLWKIVNDETAVDIIEWNKNGDGFVIHDQIHFMLEYLPKYFKHNNLSSFIRQLNLYGFHKVANIDKNEIQFTHPCFRKDVPQMLTLIKRKLVNHKTKIVDVSQPTEVEQLVSSIKHLKSHHKQVEDQLKSLKRENAALWSEISSIRVKYVKQSKVINKLIQFLVSYMQNHHGANRKQLSQKSSTSSSTNLTGKEIRGATIFELDSNGCPNEFWRKFDETNDNIMTGSSCEAGPSVERPECEVESVFEPDEEVIDEPEEMDFDEQPMQFILKDNQLIPVTSADNEAEATSEQPEPSEIEIKQEPEQEPQCSAVVVTNSNFENDSTKKNLHDEELEIDMDSLQDILKGLNGQEVESIYRMFETDWPPQQNKTSEMDRLETPVPENYQDKDNAMEVANLPSDEVNDLDFDLYSVMPEIGELLND